MQKIFIALVVALGWGGSTSDLYAQVVQAASSRFDQLMYGTHRQQQQSGVRGHSHNDYEQDIPLLRAYYSGMESIEADLFLRNDTLFVAHEARDVSAGRTLSALYLKPLSNLFRQHGQRPFADSTKRLQLVLDLKEDYRSIMPKLTALLQTYRFMLDTTLNKHAIQIVVSGNMPPPSAFKDYPEYILFDGRFTLDYTDQQLQRVAMMSDNLRIYTQWNGKGVPTKEEMARITKQSAKAHKWHKPFRLWGAPENVNAWIVLERMGVHWLNTDHPDALKAYLDELGATRFKGGQPYTVYHPTYAKDGYSSPVKNVILLIGDGMGLGHIQAAMTANKGHLNMGQMKHIGFSLTASASPGNTDSGAGGSAIATGKKVFNGTISVDTSGRRLLRLPELLATVGKVSGVLSTGDASDATPAAFYASHINRNASEDITESLLENDAVKIVAGELPAPYRDEHKKQALEQKLKRVGYQIVHDPLQFKTAKADKIIAYFGEQEMKPMKDGRGAILMQMLTATIDHFQDRGTGFFIMAEGAQIDYGGHARDLDYVVTETMDFDQAVGEALRFADSNGETLVIVTADHETGALSLLDTDVKSGRVQANFASNDHSSMMVPVMAYGPGAQHFIGYYQNTELYSKIASALGALSRP